MSRKLKVWGGSTFVHGVQVRAIVATTSQKAASEATCVSIGYLREFWSQTGNPEEVAQAMSEPGTMFYNLNSKGGGRWLARRQVA